MLADGQYWCYLTIMRPLPFTWPYALVFWAIYIWAFVPEWRIVTGGVRSVKAGSSSDSGSLQVMLGGMWVTLFLAFPLSFVRSWMFPARIQLPMFAIGISLMLLGSVLRRYCFKTLGEYFTGDVRARSDQPVIDTGPYRLVRHPSYTAGMMMFAGIGFALGSWISLVLLLAGSITTYWYRVRIEERALAETIGEPYRNFMKARKRFIPHVI
jgi:protein-S-isoprenylcysteine O-methyltransferase Ste14